MSASVVMDPGVLEDGPVGRVFYGASTLVCTPASRAGGRARARRAGPVRGRHGQGFTRFRRAPETPFNIVLEARP
jgi:hypothetical protein